MARREALDFDDFFVSTFTSVVRGAFLVVGDWEVAREVSQEAFVRAATHWPRVVRMTSPAGWVRKVAFRLALRAKEAERRGSTPLPVARPSEARIDVAPLLEALSPMQRAAVALHYFDDLPMADVARVLGCSESTARVHVFRARQRLGDLIQQEEREEAEHGSE